MLNFCSLYSGSTGNCLFVESNNCKVLIDAGVSAKKVVEGLNFINVNPDEIDAILVTHEHIDHVSAIGTLSKKYNIPVFANDKTWEAMPGQASKIDNNNQKKFSINEKFEICDIHIHPFSIPHDAINPCGFSIYNKNEKISIATDLGHINKDILKNLENSKFILLESNYDLNILKTGNYPILLKKRISGPNGHLSNELAGDLISYLIKCGLKSVMLGHLSKENNFPELAYQTVLGKILEKDYSLDDINLLVANRLKPSEVINIV